MHAACSFTVNTALNVINIEKAITIQLTFPLRLLVIVLKFLVLNLEANHSGN